MSEAVRKKTDSDDMDRARENARRAVAALSKEDRDRLRELVGSVTKASCERIMRLTDDGADRWPID